MTDQDRAAEPGFCGVGAGKCVVSEVVVNKGPGRWADICARTLVILPLSPGTRCVAKALVQCTTCRARMLPRDVCTSYGCVVDGEVVMAVAAVCVSIESRDGKRSSNVFQTAVTRRYGHSAPAL